MKVAIVGGGALGTLLGAHLCAGNVVSVVEKVARCEFISEHGLKLIQPDGTTLTGHPEIVSTNFAEIGPQEVVFLSVKAYDLPEVAQNIASLLDDKTVIVTTQNGIPWWYFQNHPGQFEGLSLKSLDPDHLLAKHIDVKRIIGCVSYPAAELLDNGAVRHVEGWNLPVGELDGRIRGRTEKLVQLLEEAGFKSRAITDIRAEHWLKAWGALSINPVSALTRAKMDGICTNAASKRLIATMMKEAAVVAESLGITFRHTIEKRIEGAKAVGPHKTSMLCDMEAGRRLETDALIGSIVELAQITGRAVPSIEAIYACMTLLDTGR